MGMRRQVSWTRRCDDGVKREVRVEFSGDGMRWQIKRADEEHWRYDAEPDPEDWEELEDILRRKAGRGKGLKKLETLLKRRGRTGA